MSSRPQPSSSSRPSHPVPKTIKLRAHALLSLPYRLTHPPPPQPKKPIWSITPHFRIPLDEILDRRHLPPLGLKDFEEWLLFIDRTPECLYFILWLREYKSRYASWRRQSKPSSPIRCSSNPEARTYRSPSVLPPPNPALTHFFLRAKETFLTPYAPYALPVPLDLLSLFYSTSDVPGHHPSDHQLAVPGQPPLPPDPAIFEEVEERTLAMLSQSLDRFVVATFHNVGMPRAYCGCAGGTVIGLAGSAPILLANFLTGGSRWWRFSALPGLWLGMTIVLSAMYGVCMMIYVFGDLRQLRSFELARVPDTDPPVSSPSQTKQGPRATSFVLFTNPFSIKSSHAATADGIQPLTAPPPPLVQQARDSPLVPRRPLDSQPPTASRPLPPRLRLEPPAPAHTYSHIHTSARAHPSHTHMPSMSSTSTSYSVTFQHTGCPPPLRTPHDVEDDYTVSGSDYESDYDSDSDSDASSSSSHSCDTHEGTTTDAGLNHDHKCAPQRRRRRRQRRGAREPEIHISDAIYDEDPSPEGPAMGYDERARRSSVWGESTEEDVGMGATFIHPFRWDESLDQGACIQDVESQAYCAAEHQRIDAFDFDGLPPRASRHPRSDSFSGVLPSPTTPTFASISAVPHAPNLDAEKQPSRGVHFASTVDNKEPAGTFRAHGSREPSSGPVGKLLSSVQTRCGPRNVAMYLLGGQRGSTSTVAASEAPTEKAPPEVRSPLTASQGPVSPTSTLSPPSAVWPGSPSEKAPPARAQQSRTTSWKQRMRRMLQVPAFASPLTPVLNPVVTRGQWEIVVRSAVIALVVSLAVVAALVAAPETRAM
ncbi:hypothetical protein C8Q80DRAFT_1266490 [Daedaleopsis nitida]|nr:hypothetical protein C8Q80DRAFT_1266490 [Daedaleopsis nitida]